MGALRHYPYMRTASGEVKFEYVQGDLCITLPPRDLSVRVIGVLAIPYLIFRYRSELLLQAPGHPLVGALFGYFIMISFLFAAWQAFCTSLIRVSPLELTVTQQAMGLRRTRTYSIDRISRLGTARVFLSDRVRLSFRYQGFTRRIRWQLRKDDAQSLIEKIQRHTRSLRLSPSPEGEDC